MRVAFVRVHDLELAALARVEPTLLQQPVAVLDVADVRSVSVSGAARVLCCSAPARALGVAAGQTGHQARAVAPEVLLRANSPDALRSARSALADAVSTVGARVEQGREGLWVEVGDLRRLHASEGGVAAALTQCARRVGLAVSVGVASSKGVAALAARRSAAKVVPEGGEAAFLAPMPVTALPMSDALRGDLVRFGVTRLGELAKLPLDGAGFRLGEEAARAVRLARGLDDSPLVPEPLPARYEESADFDWEVGTVEPLLFALRRLVEALGQRLALRSLGVSSMVLGCRLVTGVIDERSVGVGTPTRDVSALVKIARASLEAHPPIDAVVGLRVVALPRGLRPVQLGLFDPPTPAPARLALTLTRLVALVGEGRVGAPEVPDTHRPHAVAVVRFEGFRPEPAAHVTAPDAPMALHVYRPPREAEVRLDEGRITRLSAGEVVGRVVASGGPWKVRGEWWGDPFDHEGYDLELEDGGLYLVAYDRVKQRWQLDGVYE